MGEGLEKRGCLAAWKARPEADWVGTSQARRKRTAGRAGLGGKRLQARPGRKKTADRTGEEEDCRPDRGGRTLQAWPGRRLMWEGDRGRTKNRIGGRGCGGGSGVGGLVDKCGWVENRRAMLQAKLEWG